MERIIPIKYETRIAGIGDILKSAPLVSSWVNKSGSMLPKSPVEVGKMFASRRSVLVFDKNELVSHAAITFEMMSGDIELGCVVTNPSRRHGGAATAAVLGVIELTREKYPNSRIFVLANEASSGLFRKIGGIQIAHSQIPSEFWEACETCPRFTGYGERFRCCDTPFELTHLK